MYLNSYIYLSIQYLYIYLGGKVYLKMLSGYLRLGNYFCLNIYFGTYLND